MRNRERPSGPLRCVNKNRSGITLSYIGFFGDSVNSLGLINKGILGDTKTFLKIFKADSMRRFSKIPKADLGGNHHIWDEIFTIISTKSDN